jgi:hypothetical protein
MVLSDNLFKLLKMYLYLGFTSHLGLMCTITIHWGSIGFNTGGYNTVLTTVYEIVDSLDLCC